MMKFDVVIVSAPQAWKLVALNPGLTNTFGATRYVTPYETAVVELTVLATVVSVVDPQQITILPICTRPIFVATLAKVGTSDTPPVP